MAASLSGTLAAANATALNGFDALDFTSVSIQITGTFVAKMKFQVSNDGTNWVDKNLAGATEVTTPGLWAGDIGARYVRVLMTERTSGTATVRATFKHVSLAITSAAAAAIVELPVTFNAWDSVSDTTPKQMLAAPAAGKRAYITDIIVENHDEDTATRVLINSGSNTIASFMTSPGQTYTHTFATPLRAGEAQAISINSQTAAEISAAIVGFVAA